MTAVWHDPSADGDGKVQAGTMVVPLDSKAKPAAAAPGVSPADTSAGPPAMEANDAPAQGETRQAEKPKPSPPIPRKPQPLPPSQPHPNKPSETPAISPAAAVVTRSEQ
jgi:hypothetical protein